MLKTSLINMPFASLSLPSIGLMQLKEVSERRLGERVLLDIHYINQDFGRYIGREAYQFAANAGDAHVAGLGDWFFRQAVFPEQPDNSDAYFQRYFPLQTEQVRAYRYLVKQKREGLDAFLEELIEKYCLDQEDIVGFTSMFTQSMASFALATKLKGRNPDLIVIMGGANCEFPMGREIIRNIDAVDYVFSGSGLVSFPEFLSSVLEGDVEKCSRINGVFSRRNCSEPESCPTASGPAAIKIIGDDLHLDEAIELDYGPFLDTTENNFPHREIEPTILFETSRGCWWGEKAHCTFCGLNGMTMAYRSMSPQLAIKQFQSLFEYSDRSKFFNCVDNIMPRSYVKEVFPYIETPGSATIFYEVKADLSAEDLQILSNANVNRIQPGIESLATSTLKLMKKGTSAFQNIMLLKNCATYKIQPDWNLLVGFPGEQEQVYQKYLRDIPLLTHLPPPSGTFPVRFDRYSPYFVRAKEYGLNLHYVDHYNLTYPFAEESLANLAYYFADRSGDAEYFRAMTKWIGKVREKVDAWKDCWEKLPPTLHYEEHDHRRFIVDTRSGSRVEFELSQPGQQLLDLLSAPRRRTDLVSSLKIEVDRELDWLLGNGLLFEEDERFLNLVLPEPGRRH